MKLLHAADFHLDAPFAALPPAQAALRRAEGRQLLTRLADLARTEGVDLVLLAGDLFDGETVYRETLTALGQALASIPAPVLIAPGNHDPFTPRSPYAALPWPENVTIFPREQMQAKDFPDLGCTVFGAAFCHSRLENSLLEGFSAPETGRFRIGLLHGEVCEGNSLYNKITQNHIKSSHFDYLALGHIHKPSGLQCTGATSWAYPGCPEGHGFDELGDRGCLLVQTGPGGVTADFRPLASRRYIQLPVDVTGSGPLPAAEAALNRCDSRDCVKLILTGEWDQAPDLAALEAKLAGRVFALRLRDHTRPRSGLWDRSEEDTLTGAFLRAVRERADFGQKPGDSEQKQADSGQELAELAVRFGLAALERGEDCRP